MWKQKVKEEKDHSQEIKLNNFTFSLWVKRRENFNPISIATTSLNEFLHI